MKPSLPDTPVFRALSSLTQEQLDNEVIMAQRLVTAAETYLAWARMTAEAAASLAAYDEPIVGRRSNVAAPSPARSVAGSENGTARPPLRRALLMIMSEEPRRWNKAELTAELSRREWLPRGKTPDKQLTNRLSEMVERGEVIRHSPGVFSVARIDEGLDRGTRLGDEQ